MNSAALVPDAATTSWATTRTTTTASLTSKSIVKKVREPFDLIGPKDFAAFSDQLLLPQSTLQQVAPATRGSKSSTAGTRFRPETTAAAPIRNNLKYEEALRLLQLLLANTGKQRLNSGPISARPHKPLNRARLAAKLGSFSSESGEES